MTSKSGKKKRRNKITELKSLNQKERKKKETKTEFLDIMFT